MNALTLTPARTTLAAVAVAVARRPSMMAVVSHARRYSTTRHFSDKEKAEEDQYARQQDAEKIKKLQALANNTKKELDETEKELEEAKKKVAELERKLKGNSK
ncbi:hypothetical protein DFQ27_009521, partial [Actinomortierella ambigua]